MSTQFERRPLTLALQAALETVQVGPVPGDVATRDALVGLGTMPKDSGWHGEPNGPGSFFVPYFVINTLTAVPAADGGSLASPQEDWHVPYVIQSYGVSLENAEFLADRGRIVLGSMRHAIIACGASDYKVQQIWTSQIGGASRVPYTDPPFFMQPDGGTFWMAKRRTPRGP